MKSFTGESILFNPSNELWALKRKHMSVAFYKEKLGPMLEMVIQNTHDNVNRLKQNHVLSG